MDETTGTEKQSEELLTDQLVATVIGAVAGVLASSLAKKGYRAAVAAYRAHKAAA